MEKTCEPCSEKESRPTVDACAGSGQPVLIATCSSPSLSRSRVHRHPSLQSCPRAEALSLPVSVSHNLIVLSFALLTSCGAAQIRVSGQPQQTGSDVRQHTIDWSGENSNAVISLCSCAFQAARRAPVQASHVFMTPLAHLKRIRECHLDYQLRIQILRHLTINKVRQPAENQPGHDHLLVMRESRGCHHIRALPGDNRGSIRQCGLDKH
jgi:hypothetical protein